MTDITTHDAPTIVPRQPDLHTKRMAVLILLGKNPQGLTAKLVAKMLDWPSARASAHLCRLAAYNMIDRRLLPRSPNTPNTEYLYTAKSNAAKTLRMEEKADVS